MLHLSEKEFWSMYPRKLSALLDVHVKIKGGGEDEKTDKKDAEVKKGFIDQVLTF